MLDSYTYFIFYMAMFVTSLWGKNTWVLPNTWVFLIGELGPKCVEAIKAIYAETKARVWTKKGYTDEFGTTCGVRQGCLLSPLLFTIYINDLVDEIIDVGGFCFNGVWIQLLVYPDDIVFLGPNPTILQEMFNKL